MSALWNARPGCPAHFIEALERAVNAIPGAWRGPSQSGEEFKSKIDCEKRLRGFTLAEGFDIVRNGGGTKAFPASSFFCVFYSHKSRNTRKLEDRIKKDKKEFILSRYKRENTQVR
jgi:hypothetical protein